MDVTRKAALLVLLVVCATAIVCLVWPHRATQRPAPPVPRPARHEHPRAATRTSPPPPIVVDSAMTLGEALRGTPAPDAVKRTLTIVDVRYWSFDGREHRGQLVVRKDLAADVRAIFADLRRLRFPIASVKPVSRFAWSDERSMAANNTSAFNYRRVPGEMHLSRHAFGAAIDLNPRINPFLDARGVHPSGATYDPKRPGAIAPGPVVRAFACRGWKWGGHYARRKDWQHFWKP